MNFKVTNGNNKKLLLINVPENQKDTLLKSFENFSIEEISSKEVDELRRSGVVMETTKMITTPPIYGDFFLPNDYEKTTNFEKPRTMKRNWERPYKYHRGKNDTSELEIEIELVLEDGLHVVFYPEEHPSDEYQENEGIMEMHIVRYFETSRKFQE